MSGSEDVEQVLSDGGITHVVKVAGTAPRLPDSERVPAPIGADAAHRVRLMADAYGLTAGQRALVAPSAVHQAANAASRMRAAAQIDPVFRAGGTTASPNAPGARVDPP